MTCNNLLSYSWPRSIVIYRQKDPSNPRWAFPRWKPLSYGYLQLDSILYKQTHSIDHAVAAGLDYMTYRVLRYLIATFWDSESLSEYQPFYSIHIYGISWLNLLHGMGCCLLLPPILPSASIPWGPVIANADWGWQDFLSPAWQLCQSSLILNSKISFQRRSIVE